MCYLKISEDNDCLINFNNVHGNYRNYCTFILCIISLKYKLIKFIFNKSKNVAFFIVPCKYRGICWEAVTLIYFFCKHK